MAEEIGFENGRNSNFQGLVTLTLDPTIRHTVVHHSSTSTYIPNFIEIEETFCGRTDVRTDGWTFPPSNIIRSTFGSRPKNWTWFSRLVRHPARKPSGSILTTRTVPAVSKSRCHQNYVKNAKFGRCNGPLVHSDTVLYVPHIGRCLHR